MLLDAVSTAAFAAATGLTPGGADTADLTVSAAIFTKFLAPSNSRSLGSSRLPGPGRCPPLKRAHCRSWRERSADQAAERSAGERKG